ncbi:MAG: 2-amino-4-hydroxy-6-hydroxymethyldihydropteridine diphosphokinase [Ruminococcaceae bacterium]|nr:2-amino-4-hydroxy-6-hydroxymethyldihydropteridine diphosphokinase [Oscillospiraceae bacterium]
MIAYLGIGTNIGDHLQNLIDAVESLNLLPLTKVVEVSNVYETKPVGFADQSDFLNIVVCVSTELTAHNLLGAALGIEAGMGRVRTIKNGPRIIDIDLLMYGNEEYDTKTLILPHPRMLERNFVLKPLLDLDLEKSYYSKERLEKLLTNDGVSFYCDNKCFITDEI